MFHACALSFDLLSSISVSRVKAGFGLSRNTPTSPLSWESLSAFTEKAHLVLSPRITKMAILYSTSRNSPTLTNWRLWVILSRYKGIPSLKVVQLAQAASALSFLHDLSIVHGDMKAVGESVLPRDLISNELASEQYSYWWRGQCQFDWLRPRSYSTSNWINNASSCVRNASLSGTWVNSADGWGRRY